jgi:hypothetical protein
MSWLVDPPDWHQRPGLRGMFLVGYENYLEDGHRVSYPGACFTPKEVAKRFAVDDGSLRELAWYWASQDGGSLRSAELDGISLLGMGARVPLSAAPRLLGHELTRAVLAACGYLLPAETAQGPSPSTDQAGGALPALINVEEAARLLNISAAALRGRIKRHKVPGVVRTGRRVQFHRDKLLAGLASRVRT